MGEAVSASVRPPSWSGGVEEAEIRPRPAWRRRRFVRTSGSDPVVGEEDVLPRVDAGHMAIDAIAAWRDRAGTGGDGRVLAGPGLGVLTVRRTAGISIGVAR